MTVVVCDHTEHCWCSPPPLWPADRDRWATFCQEINSRIQRVRWQEGRDDIGTFTPAIPSNIAVRPLPDGRIAPLPTNGNCRDQRGRFTVRRSA